MTVFISLKRVAPLFALLYLIFTFTVVCPLLEPLSQAQLNSLPPVPYHTCKLFHGYLHPVVADVLIPNYQQYVQPHIDAVDKKINFGENVQFLQSSLNDFDNNYHVSDSIANLCASLTSHAQLVGDWFVERVYPLVEESWTYFQSKSFVYYQLAQVQLGKLTHSGCELIKSSPLKTAYEELNEKLFVWFDRVKTIEFIAKLISYWDEAIDALVATTNNISLQEKKEFLKQEFKNLTKFNDFYKFNETKNVVAIVNHILQEVQSKADSVKEKFKGYKTATEAGELVSSVVSDLSSTILPETTVSETTDENEPESTISPSQGDDATEDEESEDDESPLTIRVTSTLTVTQSDESSETNGVSIEHVDPRIQKLNEELEYWESKVNKTLQLATNNLEIEMKPIIDSVIEVIKPNISSQLQDLQNKNYKSYQDMGNKISSINKDYEQIYETNDTSVETVSREEIRSDIKHGYQLGEDVSAGIHQILVGEHEQILTQYFRVVQDTIDILESFADNTISEFNKKLTNLLEDLNLEDDEIAWKAWKRFHKVKEDIFEFRDFLFDSTNEYNSQDLQDTSPKALGLNEWNIFVRNINFHINFLLKDNDEYLKIVRAQANVAFQLREGLIKEIENRKIEEEKRKIELQNEINNGSEHTVGKLDNNTIEIEEGSIIAETEESESTVTEETTENAQEDEEIIFETIEITLEEDDEEHFGDDENTAEEPVETEYEEVEEIEIDESTETEETEL